MYPESASGRLRDLANECAGSAIVGLFVFSRLEGEPSSINRIYRLNREEGLTVRKRRTRRTSARAATPGIPMTHHRLLSGSLQRNRYFFALIVPGRAVMQ